MSGGLLSNLVVTLSSSQLVLGQLNVWPYRGAWLCSLRFFKFGDRPRRHELGDLLFFNLSFQCQILGCFLSGEEGTCRRLWLPCAPAPTPHAAPFMPTSASSSSVASAWVSTVNVACGICGIQHHFRQEFSSYCSVCLFLFAQM